MEFISLPMVRLLISHSTFTNFWKNKIIISITKYSFVSSKIAVIYAIFASHPGSENHALCILLIKYITYVWIKWNLCHNKILKYSVKMEWFPLTDNLIWDSSECVLWKIFPSGTYIPFLIYGISLLMHITAHNTIHLLLFRISFL